MDLSFSREDEAFRQEVRDFLENEFPESGDMQEWTKILNEKGWVAPKWHKEFGGPGWTPTQRFIYDLELRRSGRPTPQGFGISMIGPIIGTYGNDEQKERFMPGIMNGTTTWCQGYSERGAGSDLAGLQTRAVRDGDNYIVNGHKIWTSGAQVADWIFCLTRTSDEGKKQEGISFLLFDLRSEGVEINPIKNIAGDSPFNECFFTDVKVPVANRIGEENKGWTYAKVLLQHERTGQSGVESSKSQIANLKKLAKEEPDGDGGSLWDDAGFRDRVHEAEIDVTALNYSELQTLADAAAGRLPGPGSSYLKGFGSELGQRLTELMIEAAGHYTQPSRHLMNELGSNAGQIGPAVFNGSVPWYLGARASTIAGGSSEVQRNVIAKNVLGL